MKAYIWKDPNDFYGMIHLGFRFGPSTMQKMQHSAALHADTISYLFGKAMDEFITNHLTSDPVEIEISAVVTDEAH